MTDMTTDEDETIKRAIEYRAKALEEGDVFWVAFFDAYLTG